MLSSGWKWIAYGAEFGPAALELLLAATLLLAIALLVNLGLRRARAALRHRVWALGMAGLLLLPLLCPLLPKFPLSLHIPIAAAKLRSLTPPQAIEPVFAAPPHEAPSSEMAVFPPARRVDSLPSLPSAASPHNVEATQSDPVAGGRRAFSDAPSWLAWSYCALILFWVLGMAWGLVAMARTWWAERRLANSGLPLGDPTWQTLLDEIKGQLGLHGTVAIGISQRCDVPLTIGWRRPTILLPPDCSRWPVVKRWTVLVHELAHVARHDVFWQVTARLACAVYCFHPLAWLAARRMRVERELACDDAVLRCGGRPDQYAAVLLDVAAAVCRRPQASAAAVAMACRNSVEQRIRAILEPGLSRLPVGPRTGKLLCLIAILVVVSTAALHPFASPQPLLADSPKPEEAKTNHAATNTDEAGSWKRGRVLDFRVINAKTNKPPASCTVIKGWDYDDGRAPHWETSIGLPVKTITDGRYRFELTQERHYRLRVEAEGYMPAVSRVFKPYKPDKGRVTYDFKLKKAPPLTGTVLGPDGKPLADAEVILATNVLYVEHRQMPSQFLICNRMVRTDAAGRFVLPPEVQPFYLVVLHREGHAKVVEEILTPEQRQAHQKGQLYFNAWRFLMQPANDATLQLTKAQSNQLRSMREACSRERKQNSQKTENGILATLTPQQRAKLRELALGPLGLDYHTVVTIHVQKADDPLCLYDLVPYADFSKAEVQKELELTVPQQNQVQAILSGSSTVTEKLLRELLKLSPEEWATRQRTNIGYRGRIGGWGGLSAEEIRKKQEEFEQREKEDRKARWTERQNQPLMQMTVALRKQFEAILTPTQLIAYQEMAVRHVLLFVWNDFIIRRELGVSEAQTVQLRQIASKGLTGDFWRSEGDFGKRMLAVLTPAQREKLPRQPD